MTESYGVGGRPYPRRRLLLGLSVGESSSCARLFPPLFPAEGSQTAHATTSFTRVDPPRHDDGGRLARVLCTILMGMLLVATLAMLFLGPGR